MAAKKESTKVTSITEKKDRNDQRKPIDAAAPPRTDTLEAQEGAGTAADAGTAAEGNTPATGETDKDVRQANLAAGDEAARKTAKAGKGKPHPNAPNPAQNLARDLILFMVDQCKALPKPWQQMGEIEQDDFIQRLRKKAELTVANAVTIAAAGGEFRKAVLELATVNAKAKTTVVQLTIPSVCSDEIHSLLDARGQRVVVLLGVDPATFGVGNDGVKADAQQRPLFKAK